MKIETDSGLILEGQLVDAEYGYSEKLNLVDSKNGDKITLTDSQYVELVRSVGIIFPSWNDDV